MSHIKIGDYVKISTDGGMDIVELCLEITRGRRLIPDGWIVTDFGMYPPERCKAYRGASSCLEA